MHAANIQNPGPMSSITFPEIYTPLFYDTEVIRDLKLHYVNSYITLAGVPLTVQTNVANVIDRKLSKIFPT